MLIEFYGENFGCFRDEFRLSMLATDIDPDSDRGIIEVRIDGDERPLRLLRAVGIYGANASGKSTLLRAAAALGELINESGRLASDAALRQYDPFRLGEQRSLPVRLGLVCAVSGSLYEYEVKFGQAAIVSERLEMIQSEGERVTLLQRQGRGVNGEWTHNEQFALLAKDFRANALLLSLADSLVPTLAKNLAVGIRELLQGVGESSASPRSFIDFYVARRAYDDSKFNSWLLNRLKWADVGVVDLNVEDSSRKRPFTSGITVTNSYELSLLHQGPGHRVRLPFESESHGTKRLVRIAPFLFELANADAPVAFFFDEIDEALHPALFREMIRGINCDILSKEVRGQLIFAAHDASLMDDEAKDAILRRDQIYLTEKNASGEARLYSVAEFKERNNLNIRRRYLQGRYGALPALGTLGE